jgi:hypothetical protein
MAKITSIYLDDEQYQAFKARAQAADRSVSALVRHLIGIYMQVKASE